MTGPDERENENIRDNAWLETARREAVQRAHTVEEKFEFFFVGLIFATLALGIQTVRFTGGWADLPSFIALLLLVVSGSLAVMRLERLPRFHRLTSETYQSIHSVKDPSEDSKLEDRLDSFNRAIQQEKIFFDRLNRDYKIQRSLFLIACVLALLGRAPWEKWYYLVVGIWRG